MTTYSFGYSNLLQESAVVTGDYSTDTDGSAIDVRDVTEQMFIANVGNPTTAPDGSNYAELRVEVSANNSDWSAAPDADVRGAVSGVATGTFAVIDGSDDVDAVYKAGYIGSENYVRCSINAVGTLTEQKIGVVSLKKGNQRPVQ